MFVQSLIFLNLNPFFFDTLLPSIQHCTIVLPQSLLFTAYHVVQIGSVHVFFSTAFGQYLCLIFSWSMGFLVVFYIDTFRRLKDFFAIWAFIIYFIIVQTKHLTLSFNDKWLLQKMDVYFMIDLVSYIFVLIFMSVLMSDRIYVLKNLQFLFNSLGHLLLDGNQFLGS